MIEQKKGGVAARVRALMPEREIFVRAGGAVRFVKISTRTQLAAAGIALCSALAITTGAGAMLWQQGSIAAQRASLAAERNQISGVAAKASADKRSVDAVATELEQRQNALDALVHDHFGNNADGARLLGNVPAGSADAAPASARKIGMAPSASLTGAARLQKIEQRQIAFTQALSNVTATRINKVEAAIRGFGLNPSQLVRTGRGGPFIPASAASLSDIAGDSHLRNLADLLDRLTTLEATLGTIPSGRPTSAPMETSSYGYRRDPFNGRPAFHAGMDFPGAYGQPILAASAGRVTFVGQRSGYGNCVEIDHGHGIMTRYAHMSGFTAHVGERVQRGEQVGRMGSTGRSTGTHLHFEVRVNGAPVNPRSFLEAKQDVLETQQIALDHGRNGGNRG